MSWSVEPEGTILMGGFPDDWITLISMFTDSKSNWKKEKGKKWTKAIA